MPITILNPPNTIVLLGDSITDLNALGGGRGFFNWANIILSQRFKVIKESGIGGERSDQILARVPADVLAYKPGYCMVLVGTNDITQGYSADVTFANIKKIYEMLMTAKIKVIASTILPHTGYTTSALRIEYFKLNRLIRDYAWQNKNIIFADFASVFIDSINAYPVPATGMIPIGDTVHPSTQGAYKIGKYLANILDPLVTKHDSLVILQGDPNNISVNPMMVGTGGTLGTGASGVVADGWTLVRATGSKVSRVDGKPGIWQQIYVPSGGGHLSAAIVRDLTTGFTAGDTLYGECEFEGDSDWSNVEEISLSIRAIGPSSTLLATYAMPYHDGITYLLENPTSGVLRTNDFVVPATTSYLSLAFNFKVDGGTVRVSRVGLRKAL